jgi:hypothetical protein
MSGQGTKARLSRAEARQAFLEEAAKLWDEYSAWYDGHPDATFDEMEEEVGEEGRAHLGQLVELTLRRGDLGAKAEGVRCERCGGEMVFKGYPAKGVQGLKVDVTVRRAYYVCPKCDLGLFPLDRRLSLRRDRWSEGLVRAVAWLGTTLPSFRVAAEGLSRLVGVWMSDTTLWRCHGEVAEKVEQQLAAEEEELRDWAAEPGEEEEHVAAQAPVEERASVSMDGSMVRIRGEGYREVKAVSISEVEDRAEPRQRQREGAGQRGDEVRLTNHSYRAVLGDKATFELGLRGELVRRRVRHTKQLTAVNDGADWIWDEVERYLPAQCVGVLDWSHAVDNLAKAGAAAWGEGTKEARDWLEARKAELWNGDVSQVLMALQQLPRRRKDRGRVIRNVQEYVVRHAQRMDYSRFRAEGRPIGSGTIESAAKNVVQGRMKRGGQSWSPKAATRMLAALGEVHSDRWEYASHRLARAA